MKSPMSRNLWLIKLIFMEYENHGPFNIIQSGNQEHYQIRSAFKYYLIMLLPDPFSGLDHMWTITGASRNAMFSVSLHRLYLEQYFIDGNVALGNS